MTVSLVRHIDPVQATGASNGELWPYELYGYDADEDYYYRIASVYSAGKDIMEQAGVREEYPWLDSVLGQAKKIGVPYRDLTEADIAAECGGAAPIQIVPPQGMPAGG